MLLEESLRDGPNQVQLVVCTGPLPVLEPEMVDDEFLPFAFVGTVGHRELASEGDRQREPFAPGNMDCDRQDKGGVSPSGKAHHAGRLPKDLQYGPLEGLAWRHRTTLVAREANAARFARAHEKAGSQLEARRTNERCRHQVGNYKGDVKRWGCSRRWDNPRS